MSKRNSIRRRKALQVLGAASVGGLAGCVGGQDTQTTQTTTVKESTWEYDGPDISDRELHFMTTESSPAARRAWQNATRAFENQTGAFVNMDYAQVGGGQQRLTQLLQAGDPPDLVEMTSFEVSNLHNQGVLAPMTDAFQHWADKWGEPNASQRVQIDGEDWLVPSQGSAMVFWYRRDAFDWEGKETRENAGTWSEMLEAAKAADEENEGLRGTFIAAGQRSCVINILMGFAYSNEAHAAKRDDNGEVQIALTDSGNRERWIETLNFINDLHQYSPPASDAGCGEMVQSITSNSVASAMYSGARTKNNTVNQELPFAEDLTAAFQPYKSEKVTYGRPEGFATFQDANTTVAQEFVKMLSEPEFFMPIYEMTPVHLTPQFPGIIESEPYQRMLDNLPDAWKDLDKTIPFTSQYKSFATETDPVNPYVGPIVESQLLEGMFGRVVYRDEDPETVLEETQNELSQILEEAKQRS